MEAPVINAVCRACGSTLSSRGASVGQLCYACLLETALEQEQPDAGQPGRADAESIQTSFAHYEIATDAAGHPQELGRGAMAVTYRAIDTVLRCPVALKVINVDLAAQPRTRTRFLREAQAAAGLRHPHIASVFFFGERFADGHPFYAMELVEGETLQDRVRRCGGLPTEAALEIGRQIASALAAAEAGGITHRDLKPANLMLVAGSTVNVKVIDFGLAKVAVDPLAGDPGMTQTAEFVGTPAFASPEQFEAGERVDVRSDFYALGATLWYALTGEAPFERGPVAEIHERQLHRPLPLAQLRAARVPRAVQELLCSLLSADAAGRPQTAADLDAALQRCRERVAVRTVPARWRMAAVTAGVGGLVALVAAGGWLVFSRSGHPSVAPGLSASPAGAALEKSLAVLPFDNLSADKANVYFADGVQDEILTDLAHVADLKVISRTSVLGYRDAAKRPSTREMGRALGVAYLLEGSVQRDDRRVRVNAQLIDAAADRHVWGQVFDGDVADIFAIQSEIARQITDQLQARLSREETATFDAPPTRDLMAYELYLHAKELIHNFDENTDQWEPIYQAVRLLEEATARDPNFLVAWCLLASEHDDLIWYKADASPARQAQADAALAAAVRIAPDSGETHLALAGHYYKLHNQADGRKELALAQQKLPNDSRVSFMTSNTSIIAGDWPEALAAMQRARALNPRQLIVLDHLTAQYYSLRRYDEARTVAKDAIAAGIGTGFFQYRLATYAWEENGDTGPYHDYFRHLTATGAPSQRTTGVRIQTALCDRDFNEADRVLAADPRQEFEVGDRMILPRAFFEADNARARGDMVTAKARGEVARSVLVENTRRKPDDARGWMYLGNADAWLGHRDDALREARQALTLCPISRDALEGPSITVDYAMLLARVGEKENALSLLERLVNVPSAFHYGYLRMHPDWDILKGEPRFEAVVQASRAPIDLTKFHPADFPPPK